MHVSHRAKRSVWCEIVDADPSSIGLLPSSSSGSPRSDGLVGGGEWYAN
ncbi:MAG: hypothetical protein R2788_11100 [Saprospiraceae bacterium]